MKLAKLLSWVIFLGNIEILFSDVDSIQNFNQQAQEIRLLVEELDDIFFDLVSKYPNDMSTEEFDDCVYTAFNVFYNYVACFSPQPRSQVLIMFLYECELIFRCGKTSKCLQHKDQEIRKSLCDDFITTWVSMLKESLNVLVDSLHETMTV